MKRGLTGLVAALAVAAGTAALAHHSAAGIDRTRSVTLVGTIRAFGWQNPHSWMEVDVPADSGGIVTWRVEMTSPAFLIRAGWKATTVKPGDKATVKVFPLRDGDPGGLFQSITLADGRVLTERPAQPAPSAP